MKNIAFILAGGNGSRFGSHTPKQFLPLAGREMLSYSVEALQNARLCDGLFIVCPAGEQAALEARYRIPCIAGGDTRNRSLYYGLLHIQKTFEKCQNVFIQEAARPMLTSSLVDHYFTLLEDYDSVITAAHISDSLGKYGQQITLRDEYYLIQAPEAFRFRLLFSHFDAESPVTATVQQMPKNSKMLRYFDFPENIKVTYPEDFLVAEYLIKHREAENEATGV